MMEIQIAKQKTTIICANQQRFSFNRAFKYFFLLSLVIVVLIGAYFLCNIISPRIETDIRIPPKISPPITTTRSTTTSSPPTTTTTSLPTTTEEIWNPIGKVNSSF